MENEEKVYEFTDKYIENLEDHSNFSERSGIYDYNYQDIQKQIEIIGKIPLLLKEMNI